ncbi:hypothetical protein Tco_1101754 [Tanacetum coccineum]
MEQVKAIHLEAHDYLVYRNPNSWCRAFFNLNSKCHSFENGIAESFNRAILVQSKPIITMLEDIRLMWTVIPSGFQELEVRRGDESFGVNIQLRKCMCRMWELSSISCVHSVVLGEVGWVVEVSQVVGEVRQVMAEMVAQAEVVEIKAEVSGVKGEVVGDKAEVEMNEDEIRTSMEHEYREQLLVVEEEKRVVEKNGKLVEPSASVEPPKMKKQGRKRKEADTSDALPFMIYHKNIGRSERIFNPKMEETRFGPNGEGSTTDKAFSLKLL